MPNTSLHSLLPVYRRSELNIARGEGVYLYSPDGTRYLDFAAGIAVNALGHCHPHVVAALKNQADILWHCSNMYRTAGLESLAARLTDATFADKVFFCNSGTEAVECGLKMVRKYYITSPSMGEVGAVAPGGGGHSQNTPSLTLPPTGGGKYRVITMIGGFHGRTLACISAGGNDIARRGYGPLLEGFDRVEFNNLAAMEAAITPETAAILVEPIQGEGGIRCATPEFLRGLRALCDQRGLLLFIDEVQCGMGRTGSLFAYEQAGITPDIVTSAKGIGNGFPLAACLTTDKVASVMTPGSHGSTYGGNPLAMAVGNAVLDMLLAPGFFAQVALVGAELKTGLATVAAEFPQLLEEVRGTGLMLGLKTRVPPGEMVEKLRARGLLTAPAEDSVIRITPPLIIESAHVGEALQILRLICKEWV